MIGCHRFSITVLLIVAAIAREIAEVMKQEVYKLYHHLMQRFDLSEE